MKPPPRTSDPDFVERMERREEELRTEIHLLLHRSNERLLARIQELREEDSHVWGEKWFHTNLNQELMIRILKRLSEGAK